MQLHEPSAGDDLIEFEPSLYKIEKAKGVVKSRVAHFDASGSQMESRWDLHEDHETGQSESEQPAGAKDGNTPKRCKHRRRESRVISLPIAIGSSDIGSQVNSTLKKAILQNGTSPTSKPITTSKGVQTTGDASKKKSLPCLSWRA